MTKEQHDRPTDPLSRNTPWALDGWGPSDPNLPPTNYGPLEEPEPFPTDVAQVAGRPRATARSTSLLVVVGFLALALIGTSVLWLTTASDLKAEQQRAASLEQEIDNRAATDSAVPDLKATADTFFGKASYVFGDADSVSITVTDYNVSSASGPLAKMLDELGFSSAVLDRMSNTRALDGTLDAQGKNCNVTWTYHPDDGLQMVFEAAPAT